jgi:hypothetical protein
VTSAPDGRPATAAAEAIAAGIRAQTKGVQLRIKGNNRITEWRRNY